MNQKEYKNDFSRKGFNKFMEPFYFVVGLFVAFLKRSYIVFKELYYKKKFLEIHKSVKLGENILMSGKISIGEGTYVQRNCSIVGDVKIGKNCAIASNVNIWSETHEGKGSQIKSKIIPIEIGDYVWIGTNVFVKEGIKIGDNVIIGANSVVTKNIPSNTTYAGVPAKRIK